MNSVQEFPCPICAGPSTRQWTKSDFQLNECEICTHLFCDAGQNENYLTDVYGDDYFEGSQGGYSDYLAHGELLIEQGKMYAKRLERHRRPGKILDIGSAAGFFLKGFSARDWTPTGVEVNTKMAVHSQNEFGMNVFNGPIEDYEPDSAFDAVSIIQVISHLRDPVACLQKANQYLLPGGLLLIETWNRKSLTARGFGKNWHQYNPPSVLHWYTKRELETILGNAGFDVVDRGRPTKWISIGNGVSLIRHTMRESLVGRVATAPLAVVPKGLKVPYFLDDVFWFIAKKR